MPGPRLVGKTCPGCLLVHVSGRDQSAGFAVAAGPGASRSSYMTRAQLTDEEWAFIEPYLPIGEYGPYPERLRQQFEGVIWRFKTGGQWREVPQEFGAWSTVHNRFRQWRDAGVFEAL